MIKTYERIMIGFAAAGVLALLFIFHQSALEAAADRAKLDATLKQQGEIIKGLNQQIKDRDATAVQQNKKVDQQVAGAKTLQQQAALLAQLAGMRQPITIQLPAAADGKKNPDALSSLVFSPEQTRRQLDFDASCKKCENNLAAAVDVRAQQEAKIQSLTEERDTAVNSSRGGSKWERFKRNGKLLCAGTAIGGTTVVILRALLSHH